MSILSLERSNTRLKRCLASRKQAAIGLLTLSVVWNIGQAARINRLEVARMETSAQLVQAELARDRALDSLGQEQTQYRQTSSILSPVKVTACS